MKAAVFYYLKTQEEKQILGRELKENDPQRHQSYDSVFPKQGLQQAGLICGFFLITLQIIIPVSRNQNSC